MSTSFPTTTTFPWEHRRWRNGTCSSGLGVSAIAFWVAVAVCAGIITLIAFKSPRMLHFSQVRWEVLFPGVIALFGAGFLVSALIATARWFRFGRCRVQMRTVPGVIGGHFRGEVLLPESFPSDTDVRMELICETTTTITGKGDSSDHLSIDRVWSHTVRVTANASLCHDGACIIPFDFTIPYGLTDETDSKVEGNFRVDISWILRVFAKLNGPDLNMRFHVPVFRTATSDPSVKGDPQTEKPLEAFLHDMGQGRRIRMEFENGAMTYVCDAMGMQAGVSFVPMIFGVVFLAAGLFAGFNGLPELIKEVLKPAQGWMNLFRLIPLMMSVGLCLLTVVFSLFGLLFLFIGVSGLIARRTWIENGMIHQRSRFLGIPWTRQCPCSSATGVNLGDTTKSGGQTWYDVVIERNTEAQYKRLQWRYLFSRITVATNVPTEREAQDIMDHLKKDLHL
ncbi:MAG: hypothetical protein WCP12_06535 [bacterium]